jgi:hypothetical protein
MSSKRSPSARMFTDVEGRAWIMRFEKHNFKEILKHTGVDLRTLVDRPGNVVTDTLNVGNRLVQIIGSLCEKQARKRGMEAEEFATVLESREVLLMACTTMLGALADAFPRSLWGKGFEAALKAWIAAGENRFTKDSDDKPT